LEDSEASAVNSDNAVTDMTNPLILPTGPHGPLLRVIAAALEAAGGWIGFDEFMALALYAPGAGYYTGESVKFGLMPAGRADGATAAAGSDFATAPEISPHFGRALARQVGQALLATGTAEVWEFGAGTGALAAQLLDQLGGAVGRYTIVDLSGSLRERQRLRLEAHAGKVRWLGELPDAFSGVVVGNEVLDAMPVKLLARAGGIWHERGVVLHEGRLTFADRPTSARPPVAIEGTHDYLTEIHLQAEGFVRTLADRLERGAAFFIDYGFPEHEYYHPQRSMGTVMCHRGHRMDADPLADVGTKDITAHVNFTGVALAGQEAGLHVMGYASQGRFLLNCGLVDGLGEASLADRVMLQKLVNEHEMGELFKVIGFAAGALRDADWQPIGFAQGDRSHTL
jgi:SAM-dependent MidA family methyltransferase